MAKKLEVTDEQYKLLYDSGLSDIKIGEVLKCSKVTIRNWRNKNNLVPNFRPTIDKYNSWSKDTFLKLYNDGLTDAKIALKLSISETVVNNYRNKLKLKSNQSHNIEITKDMEEVIVGTLLGDGNINCKSKSEIKIEKDTAILTFAHCLEQKEYCFHKYNKLVTLFNREPIISEQERKGNINISYYAISKSSISLKKYYSIFYREGKKIIPANIEEYFTYQSLAYLYMDDGSFNRNSHTISLCDFDFESLSNLQILLFKWNIHTTLWKSGVLYIKSKSNNVFRELIKPYIIPNMDYKINVLLKLGELLESPEFVLIDDTQDNQQPS